MILDFLNRDEVMKTIDSIDDGIGSPDWKLSLCLLLAWIIICAILMKGVRHSLTPLNISVWY